MGNASAFDAPYFEGGVYGRFADASVAAAELAHWYAGAFRLLDRRFGHSHPVGGQVLELGAGHGAVLGVLERRELLPIGTDLSPFVLRQQRASNPQRALAAADAASLPFDGDSFDAVLTFEVVEHLPDPVPAFREIVRVLRQGGVLVATTPNPAADRWPLFDSRRDPTHVSVQPVKAWEDTAAAVGLRDVAVHTYLQIPYFWRKLRVARRVVRTGRFGPTTLILARKR